MVAWLVVLFERLAFFCFLGCARSSLAVVALIALCCLVGLAASPAVFAATAAAAVVTSPVTASSPCFLTSLRICFVKRLRAFFLSNAIRTSSKFHATKRAYWEFRARERAARQRL